MRLASVRQSETLEAAASWLRPAWRFAVAVLLGYAAWVALMLPVYRFADPPLSNHMLARALAGEEQRHSFVPLSAISPALVRAVVISEDANYCDHWGVDWSAMWETMRQGGGGGASTIPMQAVKNMFLWNGRTFLRKIPEVPLAHAADLVWGKRRLIEIYLNIAEWGPGIYGAEAAARHHFKVSASALTAQQASLLAAALPNPIQRNASRPAPKVRSRAMSVRRQFGNDPDGLDCVFP